MRALVCQAFGSIDDLQLLDTPSPKPGPGEVLIDVVASSANYADSIMVAGKYQTKPAFPFGPGLEAAGYVAALGPDVAGFEVGQAVMATVPHSGFAEQVLSPVGSCWPLFEGMDFTTAAAFPVAYLSAHVALRWQGRLETGETLLVLGAAGGSGLAAVEIGRAMGAKVIAAASSAEKLALAADHGAHELINYKDQDLKDLVMELTDNEGADVCFDPVGGPIFDKALSSLGWGGRHVHFGFVAGVPQVPSNRLLVKHRSALGSSLRYFHNRKPHLIKKSMVELAAHWGNGFLKPSVSHQYPLADGIEALRLLVDRKALGKVVVRVRDD